MITVNLLFKSVAFVSFLFVSVCNKNGGDTSATPPPVVVADTTFTNPLLASGPDPWVIQKDSFYYVTHTFGNRIAIYKTSRMSELRNTMPVTVWTPPATGLYSKQIWAPELHYLDGKWYIYFAADDGDNAYHRMYVLENSASDPTSAGWELKGKISAATDKWAIDGSVFTYNGNNYFIWSGWEGDVDGQQNIYIAKMKNPWTIEGERVLISSPTDNWEKSGAPPVVNEGPEALINKQGKVFLTYSASGCWTDNYSLGLLSLKDGGDPMNAANWIKHPTPVLTSKPENGAYAPGHNGFFVSRDGKEDWIIYHANSKAGQGCGSARNPRMQQFSWKADGTPNFGEPVKIDVPIKKPSGEY